MVTDGCQGCMAHPCVEVCPKGAVSLDRFNGRSVIDQEKCIKCGRCMDVCKYHAIIRQERPCAAACGMDAISHQLRVLKQSALVKFRRDGKTVYYSLADTHVATILAQGLDHVQE